MTNPKITLSAGISPIEGAIGTYIIGLDTPAPAGGLTVYYSTTGSTATLNDDYNFRGGDNLRAVTDNSFTITAGATTATLNLVAHSDGVIDPKEKVVVNLAAGAVYDLVNTNTQFSLQTTIPADLYIRSIISADFNNDGNTDLATVSQEIDTVSVHLGNGKGGFTGNTRVAVGKYPFSVTTADFNNDGNADLATTNAYDDTVSVRLGNGKGGFTGNTSVAVGDYPLWMTSADFNGDGKSDLATANYTYDGSVSVLLGNGNGSFTEGVDIAAGRNPDSLFNADFNNDGNADLGVASYYTNNVLIRLGNGNGGFKNNANIVVGGGVKRIVMSDFNNDGNTDLAVANLSKNTISVLLGNGEGGFTSDTDIAVGYNLNAITTADFNNDGNADLVTDNRDDGTVSVRLGNGKGGFTSDIDIAVVDTPNSIISTDFNNDGNTDLAITNTSKNFFAVLLNTSTGGFTSSLTINDPINHAPTGSVMLNDFTPKLNQLLTVKNTLADADGLGPITYQWQANNVNIGTGNSYKVTGNEVGKAITVIASYTDGVGYTEKVSSKPVTIPLTASFTITPTTPQNTGENGKTASYSIHLNTAPLPNQNVVVTFTSSDTSEGIINNPTLTFTSANYATPQTLKIRGVDDYLDDGDIPYSVTAQVTTLDVFYKKLTIAPFNLTNTDDGLDKALDLKGDQGGSKIDVLNGGNGADTLHGLNMDDNLSGGINNDTLYGGYGDDNLFGENGDDQLFGEQNNDYMDGGAGNDVLSGGVGNDNLTGGSGQDSFLFDSALKANIDTITDFKPVDDTITLENIIFTKLTTTGALNADNFVTATAAIDSNDYLVYNKATGALFYDADGSGAGAGIQIATIGVNLALTAADFVVI